MLCSLYNSNAILCLYCIIYLKTVRKLSLTSIKFGFGRSAVSDRTFDDASFTYPLYKGLDKINVPALRKFQMRIICPLYGGTKKRECELSHDLSLSSGYLRMVNGWPIKCWELLQDILSEKPSCVLGLFVVTSTAFPRGGRGWEAKFLCQTKSSNYHVILW